MTALITQLTGATFSAANILMPGLPTVPGGATAVIWNYLGVNITQSQNLITGAPATLQLGTPTYQAAYASGLNGGVSPIGFDTQIKDDNKTFTIFFAARHTGAVDAQVSIPIANNDNATSFGIANSLSGTGWAVATNASGISRTLAVTGVTNWKVYCISYDDTARIQSLYNLSDGTQDVFTGTGSRNLSATGNFFIGANPRTATGGTRTCDVAMAGMIKGQAVTLPIAQQYAANIKANLALRGLIVP